MPFLQWHITRSARHVRPSLFNHGPSSVPRPRHLRHPSRKFISVLTTGSRSSFAFLSRLAAPKLLPPWRSPHSAFSRQPHKSNQPTITQPVPITTTQLNSTNRDHAPQLEHHPPPWFSPGRCLYVSLSHRLPFSGRRFGRLCLIFWPPPRRYRPFFECRSWPPQGQSCCACCCRSPPSPGHHAPELSFSC